MDFHPFAGMYDEAMNRRYPYFGKEAVVETSGVPDYVADASSSLAPSGFSEGVRGFENAHADFTFPFGLGELVTACATSGLLIERLDEYDYANGARLFSSMRELPGRRWALAEGDPAMPLMFGLIARRRG